MKRIPKVGRPKTTSRERFEISLDAFADADILEKLNRVPNKSDYVRALIREDIKKSA